MAGLPPRPSTSRPGASPAAAPPSVANRIHPAPASTTRPCARPCYAPLHARRGHQCLGGAVQPGVYPVGAAIASHPIECSMHCPGWVGAPLYRLLPVPTRVAPPSRGPQPEPNPLCACVSVSVSPLSVSVAAAAAATATAAAGEAIVVACFFAWRQCPESPLRALHSLPQPGSVGRGADTVVFPREPASTHTSCARHSGTGGVQTWRACRSSALFAAAARVLVCRPQRHCQ